MRVHTTHLNSKNPTVLKEKSPLEKKGRAPEKKVPVQEKKGIKPPPQVKKPLTPIQEKKSPMKRIEELERDLKKIETSFKEAPKDLFVGIEYEIDLKDSIPYETQVVQILQKALRLVDPESVDVVIQVLPNGLVETILEIRSNSPLNAKIVATALEKMVFPPFEANEPLELSLHLCTGN
jgi:hypothetical protein